MTGRPHGVSRVMVTGAVTAAASLVGVTATNAADVRLSFRTGKPTRVVTTADSQYAAGETVWLACPRAAMPLMVGFEGVQAPVRTIYSNNLVSSRTLGIAISRPAITSTFRSTALCATGVRVQVRESSTKSVSCSATQIAIGVPIDGGGYQTAPVSSKPDGLRGWRVVGGGMYARAKAICVPSSAFRSVAVVSKPAPFAAGAETTTVAAQCRGGRRPVSWGYEAGVLEANRWGAAGASAAVSVPFIVASKAQGRSGWALTFATPDGRPAVGTTSIGISVTCAIPR